MITKLLKIQTFEDHFVSGDLLLIAIDGREIIVVQVEPQSEVIRQAHENGYFGVRMFEEVIK